MVKNKKALTTLSVLVLSAMVFAGCNTSTTNPNKQAPQEATTAKGTQKSNSTQHFSNEEILSFIDYDIDSRITLPKDYQHIKVEYKKPEISEKEFNDFLDEELKRYAIYEKTDKKNVDKNDVVEITYETLVDGKREEEPFTTYVDLKDEDSIAINFDYDDNEMEDSKVIKEFVGKKVGDSFEIKNTIEMEKPEDTKSVVYKGTIKSIAKTAQIDHNSLDDEKAKKIAKEYTIQKDGKNCQTKDELIEELKSSYIDDKNSDYESEFNDSIMRTIIDKSKFNITKEMIQEERDRQEKQIKEALKNSNYGYDYDDYVKAMKEEMGDDYNSDAQKEDELKYQFLRDALIRDLKISVTEEEIIETTGGESIEEIVEGYSTKEDFILEFARYKAENELVKIVRKNNGLPEEKEPAISNEDIVME